MHRQYLAMQYHNYIISIISYYMQFNLILKYTLHSNLINYSLTYFTQVNRQINKQFQVDARLDVSQLRNYNKLLPVDMMEKNGDLVCLYTVILLRAHIAGTTTTHMLSTTHITLQ